MNDKNNHNTNTNNNTIIINLDKKNKRNKSYSPKQKSNNNNNIQKPIIGDNRFTTVLQQTPQLNRDYLNLSDKIDRLNNNNKDYLNLSDKIDRLNYYGQQGAVSYENLKNYLEKNIDRNDNFDVESSLSSNEFIPQGNTRTFYSPSSIFNNTSIRQTPNYLNSPDYTNTLPDNPDNNDNFSELKNINDSIIGKSMYYNYNDIPLLMNNYNKPLTLEYKPQANENRLMRNEELKNQMWNKVDEFNKIDESINDNVDQNYLDEQYQKQMNIVQEIADNKKADPLEIKNPNEDNKKISDKVIDRLLKRENHYEDKICPICGQQFASYSNMKTHLGNVHAKFGKLDSTDKEGGNIDIKKQAKDYLKEYNKIDSERKTNNMKKQQPKATESKNKTTRDNIVNSMLNEVVDNAWMQIQNKKNNKSFVKKKVDDIENKIEKLNKIDKNINKKNKKIEQEYDELLNILPIGKK